MGADQNFNWRDAAVGLLDWWEAAGVDVPVGETARDWRNAVPASPASATPLPVAASGLPTSLAELEAWRIGADAPEAAWGRPSVVAEGDPLAGLVVLVDQPERDAGLLGGAPGRLFDAMLRAIGRDRGSIYLIAVCACRAPAGRIAAEVEQRLFEVARHHVGLAEPQRVLALGNAASRALTGVELAKARGGLRSVNPVGGKKAGTDQAVASFHPRLLIERPALKAEAWKDLLMLMGGADA